MRENTVRDLGFAGSWAMAAAVMGVGPLALACAPLAAGPRAPAAVQAGAPSEPRAPVGEAESLTIAVDMQAQPEAAVEESALDSAVAEREATASRRPPRLTINARMSQRCELVRPVIERAARSGGVDPLLLLAIAWVESGFNPEARSRSGALGVMQMIPRTARVFGCSDAADSRCSAAAATAYFARLRRMFSGETVFALCAYHSGHVPAQKAWRSGMMPQNLGYATRVLEARGRLQRYGCAGK